MQFSSNDNWAKPSKKWPSHWKDLLHDEDGGYYMFGRRTHDGRPTLKDELANIAFADGAEWAQDDVSGANLLPSLSSRHGRSRLFS